MARTKQTARHQKKPPLKKRRLRVKDDAEPTIAGLAKSNPDLKDIIDEEHKIMTEWKTAYEAFRVAKRRLRVSDDDREERRIKLMNELRDELHAEARVVNELMAASEKERKRLRTVRATKASKIVKALGDDAPMESETDSEPDDEFDEDGFPTNYLAYPGMESDPDDPDPYPGTESKDDDAKVEEEDATQKTEPAPTPAEPKVEEEDAT